MHIMPSVYQQLWNLQKISNYMLFICIYLQECRLVLSFLVVIFNQHIMFSHSYTYPFGFNIFSVLSKYIAVEVFIQQ